DLVRKILEDKVAHLLRLLDRPQLGRQKDQTLSLSGVRDRGQQSGAKREAKAGRYSPHIPLSPRPSVNDASRLRALCRIGRDPKDQIEVPKVLLMPSRWPATFTASPITAQIRSKAASFCFWIDRNICPCWSRAGKDVLRYALSANYLLRIALQRG